MYLLTIKNSQPTVLLRSVSQKEKAKIEDDLLVLENSGINGHFKAFAFEHDIQCLCGEYRLADDFYFHKSPATSDFFTLRIHEISHCSEKSMARKKCSPLLRPKDYSVFLTSSLEEFSLFVPKYYNVKVLEISMPQHLFFERLGLDDRFGLFKKYLLITNRHHENHFNDIRFKKLFDAIITEGHKRFSDMASLGKDISSMLSIIFSNLTSAINDFEELQKIKISKDDIRRLIEVRKYLDSGTSTPTFASLTKIALMSATSLKTKFKKMYGTTVFKYFQRVRMQRARILLLTNKYSVKEIGRQLGYSNLSNFSIAFKKEFNQLPHELLWDTNNAIRR